VNNDNAIMRQNLRGSNVIIDSPATLSAILA